VRQSGAPWVIFLFPSYPSRKAAESPGPWDAFPSLDNAFLRHPPRVCGRKATHYDQEAQECVEGDMHPHVWAGPG